MCEDAKAEICEDRDTIAAFWDSLTACFEFAGFYVSRSAEEGRNEKKCPTWKRTWRDAQGMARLVPTTVATPLLLTLILLAFFPETQAYTFVAHSICKGWTEDAEKRWEPIEGERFLVNESVCLYFHVSWESCEKEPNKVDWRVVLIDPEASEANIGFGTPHLTLYRGHMEPCGASHTVLSSAFLPILNVTETTKNGMWGVDWYDGSKLLFSEKFIVGPATPTTSATATPTGTPSAVSPEKTFEELYGLWIVAAVIFIAALVVATIFLVRRKGTRTTFTSGLDSTRRTSYWRQVLHSMWGADS